MNKYIVYTWNLANKLNELGFKPIGKELNTKNPAYEVIIFEDTPELRQAVQRLTHKEEKTHKETTTQKSLFPVFSRRLTRKLETKGFIVQKIEPNTVYPDKVVYYFEETAELRQAVNELTK